MNWKEQLKKLEKAKEWDTAIAFMQKVVFEHPEDLDAYLSINYLLMNLLVEEDYNRNKHDYYAQLAKHYFQESYTKFSDNPEYLFYTGKTACMSVWYYEIETEDVNEMLAKAIKLAPNNLVYKNTHCRNLNLDNPQDKKELYDYARIVLAEDSPIKRDLLLKGSLGKYIFGMLLSWSYELVNKQQMSLEKWLQALQNFDDYNLD